MKTVARSLSVSLVTDTRCRSKCSDAFVNATAFRNSCPLLAGYRRALTNSTLNARCSPIRLLRSCGTVTILVMPRANWQLYEHQIYEALKSHAATDADVSFDKDGLLKLPGRFSGIDRQIDELVRGRRASGSTQ